MDLFVVGLNHRTTPLALREQFSVPAERLPSVLAELRNAAGLEEAVVLSTCNRLEIYGVTSSATMLAERVFQAVAKANGEGRCPADFAQIEPCLYTHDAEACVRHLFRVAGSLDSLVVGETEIVGQVKRAYQLAQASGATGKTLNRLFQKALSVSKSVRTRSGIGRCSTSVGAVALDLAMKVFGEDLTNRTILIVGAGKIGETTLRHLTKHGIKSILVANRSIERARDLVSRFDGRAVAFGELSRAVAQADIVVSSTSAPHHVLTKADLSPAMAQRRDRPLLLIDLAVPRDIDPAALEVDGVYLYNIDELSDLARLNLERRQAEAAACEEMVAVQAREVAAHLAPALQPGVRAGVLAQVFGKRPALVGPANPGLLRSGERASLPLL